MFKSNDRAAQQRARVAATQDSTQDLKSEVTYLKSELERVLMICEAQWELLRDAKGLEDKDLYRKIIDIDARDGKIDGKVTPQELKPCPECGHKLPRKRSFCFFCGSKIIKTTFER